MTKKKNPKSFKPNGRPTDFKAKYNKLAYQFCLLGATDKHLAESFNVSEQTINNWKRKHPKFFESIRRGKIIADANVAESLYRRALGYTQKVDKVFQYKGEPIIVQTTKHYPPDVQAAIIWLRNRQPSKWRDNQIVYVKEDSIDDRTPEEVQANIDELDKKIRYLEALL